MFREIIQNADDAMATEVKIEFQTDYYANNSTGATNSNGTIQDLNTTEVSLGVVLSSELVLNLTDSCPNGLFVMMVTALKTKIGNG